MFEFIEYKGFDHAFQYSGPWMYWLLGFYLLLPVMAYIIFPFFATKSSYGKRKSIAIMVLGDIGHSPRMCYHAKSFSNLDYSVSLCGYVQTSPSNDIIDDLNIEVHEIDSITNSSNLPFILFAFKKVIRQFLQLFSILFHFKGTDYILIQNPPSVPLLAIVIVFIRIFSRNTKLIIDWHNLNFSILNLRYNNVNHPFVKLVKFYEKFFAKFADLHFAVTKQMKAYLSNEFSITSPIITVYDRPASQFQPIVTNKQSSLQKYDIFDIPNINDYKILVSSTSFTPDEDFNVLLRALTKYEKSQNLPPLLLIITGKGPLKNQFLQEVERSNFSSRIIIKTAWLLSEDYPKVLALADLGVSLHSSSSGIDLPMKIVDMFGCGIPVISLNFPAIKELVHDGFNGLVCKEKADPAEEIFRLLTNVFTDNQLYQKIKNGAIEESKLRWDENWDKKLGKYFEFESN